MTEHKIVYNACHGGFRLSQEAIKFIAERKNVEPDKISHRFYYANRHDKNLVEAVETLGKHANGSKYANLQITKITGDKYWINEYDGGESVETPETIDWVTIHHDEIHLSQ